MTATLRTSWDHAKRRAALKVGSYMKNARARASSAKAATLSMESATELGFTDLAEWYRRRAAAERKAVATSVRIARSWCREWRKLRDYQREERERAS